MRRQPAPTTPRIDPLRRRLTLGLPGLLVAGSPLALVACGGGSGGTPGDDTVPDPSFVGTLPFVERPVTIALPAGMPVPAGTLRVQTLLGGLSPVSGGASTVRVLNESPQLATLLAHEGYTLLVGLVHSGQATLDTRSTAVAMLSFALGVDLARGEASTRWLQELRDAAATATLADAIGAALAADPTALARADAAIAAALAQAVEQLVAPAAAQAARARERAQGVTISPADEASGLQPLVGDALNTLVLQNAFLRRVVAVVRREGHVDATGVYIPDTARPVVKEWADGEIPAPPGLDSIVGIETALTQYHYGTDAASLAYGRTDPIELPVLPADARRVKYSVSAMMSGKLALGYDAQAYAALRDADRRLIDMDGPNPENLTLQQLVVDILVPLFMTMAGTAFGKKIDGKDADQYKEWKDLAKALVGEVLAVMQTTLPGVMNKLLLRDPNVTQYGAGDALMEIVRNHILDTRNPVRVPVPGFGIVDIPTLTPFSLEMIRLLLTVVAKQMLSARLGEPLDALLNGAKTLGQEELSNANALYNFNVGGNAYQYNNGTALGVSGAFTIFKLMGVVDSVYGTLAKARLLSDIATSRVLERWDVWVNRAKLKLTPDPLEVAAGLGTKATITASIVDNADDTFGNEQGGITYDWECTGRWGTLYSTSNTGEPNRFTSSAATPTADYFPSGAEPDPARPDTITVTAYVGAPGSKTRARIGQVTVPVKFKKEYSLRVTPASGTDLPPDTTLGLAAFVKETLPQGAAVDWTWNLAGAGTLQAQPANAQVGESAADYRSPAAEGTATVTVSARITLPASGSQGPRVVTTDPVSTLLNIKQGVKTLTLQGHLVHEIRWMDSYVFYGCGTEANPVGLCRPFEVIFYAAFPKVPGAKSTTMLLESTQPDPLGTIGYPFGPTTATTGHWIDRGSYWLQGLSSISATAGENGVQPGAGIASELFRFEGLRITATVTLA